jgi:predicted GNAT family acetyltransferase
MEIIHKNGEKNGVFIAQENGQRIGHISYEWIEPKTLGLMHTIVKPEYRGHGVAKALLDATVNYAREHGFLIHAFCSYAVREFENPEYDDVNYIK